MSQPMHDKVCPLRGGQHAHERSVENLLSVPSTPTLANTRNSWETYTHWTLGVEPEKVERMMGHAGKGVTERHYDRPEAESLAAEAARAYALHPFADGWGVREDGSLAEHDK